VGNLFPKSRNFIAKNTCIAWWKIEKARDRAENPRHALLGLLQARDAWRGGLQAAELHKIRAAKNAAPY
jgi:hypothetical protein